MADPTRPGSTIGGYTLIGGGPTNYKPVTLGSKQGASRSLIGQFGDVLRGLPGGVVNLVGKAAQTVAIPAHLGYDAVTGNLDVDSFGDFTDEYLPLADMVARSMATTVGRLRHPTRYMRAIEDGSIVGTVLEDVGNVAIIGGAASKAIGAAPNAARAGAMVAATEEAVAAGTMGSTMAATAGRAAAKVERGSGLARLAAQSGYDDLAGQLTRGGQVVRQGARKLDVVASQPFPLLGKMSGRAGEMLARPPNGWWVSVSGATTRSRGNRGGASRSPRWRAPRSWVPVRADRLCSRVSPRRGEPSSRTCRCRWMTPPWGRKWWSPARVR